MSGILVDYPEIEEVFVKDQAEVNILELKAVLDECVGAKECKQWSDEERSKMFDGLYLFFNQLVASKELKAILLEPDESARDEAAQELVAFVPKVLERLLAEIFPLLETLAKDQNESVRKAAAQGLAALLQRTSKSESLGILERLRALMVDESSVVREEAMKGIAAYAVGLKEIRALAESKDNSAAHQEVAQGLAAFVPKESSKSC